MSRAEAEANRTAAVKAASELFREKGIPNVAVADVIRAVGLTQGGFYKRFSSKAALVDEAVALGFAEMMDHLARLDADADDHRAARLALLESYLSTAHRDDPSDGCPAAGSSGRPRARPGATGDVCRRRSRDGRLDRAG
ncbi:TetR/AcrR family transcriptional regulator [Asanoa siamensis]|uniref:HTH tetR-type domain-containing protein n=1 Tax=Asanoa siamensis TaxID=926357 RepID=A0ABQ4CVV0_9ACTN|nr:TetR/AcrR family transcriptional regulator [Asanoa siamensis]GIF74962.1 hypothetical protein Asi02nite_44800 [Asanoa siamensis]